ncbi:flagellar hook-basal body complex protein FliE [bacterium LRH843]|nr:flagellar hook-basal body complex protein FliE [bacterium LRH843]
MDVKIMQSPFLIQNSTIQPVMTNIKQKVTPAEAGQTFKVALKEAINDVNSLQQQSGKKTELLASGNIDDLHDVMITGQKASVALQATVEVRNKVIEAYQEIMRMQV